MRDNQNKVICNRCAGDISFFSLTFRELDIDVCLKCRDDVSMIFKAILKTPIHEPSEVQEIKVMPLVCEKALDDAMKAIDDSFAEFGYGKL